jgi:hypothetical protein
VRGDDADDDDADDDDDNGGGGGGGGDDDDDDELSTLQFVFISLTHAHYHQCAHTDAYRTTHLTRAIDEIVNKPYLKRPPPGHWHTTANTSSRSSIFHAA